MTPQEAKKMLKAKLECFKNETSGINHDCNMRLCDGCSLNYEQGNMGEQKEALDMAIKALEQQPKMQDCEHCIHTYGTLGCCDMVNNEWVYDCEFGKEQYKKEHESQPCEDCISRQVVKDMLTAEWTKYVPMELDMNLSFVLDKISVLPSVTPKAKWIPCSERLPEKQDCYLVTTKWKGSYSGDVYIETNMAVYRERPKEWDCKDVIAWMPLPEPYRESEE